MSIAPDQFLIAAMEQALGNFTPSVFPADKSLFHYTDAGGLLGILREKKIRATHYRYLNDRDEMRRGEEIVQRVAKQFSVDQQRSTLHRFVFEKFIEHHATRSLTKTVAVFVASFTDDGNDLSQWRGYGANGAGYSLGFSGFRLAQGDVADAAMSLELYQCEYDDEAFRSSVITHFDKILNTMDRILAEHGISNGTYSAAIGSAVAHFLRAVAAIIPRLKQGAFSKECEWRLVAMPMLDRERDVIRFRESSRGVVPYVEIDLCHEKEQLDLVKLYVGPTQDPDAGLMTAKMLLSSHGYNPDVAAPSGIPFRG
jgi:hypothetical protein